MIYFLYLEANTTGKFRQAMEKAAEFKIFEKLEGSALFEYIMDNFIFYSSTTGLKKY